MRRAVKWILLTYCALFAFVFMHFPRTTSRVLRQDAPQVLLLPILAPTILRAYGQFFINPTWPFGAKTDEIPLAQLHVLHSRELPPLGRMIPFVRADPEGGPGQQGRTTYDLGLEDYFENFQGAFVVSSHGWVVRMGRYTCLSASDYNVLLSPLGLNSRCITIHPTGNGYFVWRELGGKRPIRVRLLRDGEH